MLKLIDPGNINSSIKRILIAIFIYCFSSASISIKKSEEKLYNYSQLYQEAFNELEPMLIDCANSWNNSIESIYLSDSLYILTNLDTMPIGDRNYSCGPLTKVDSSGAIVLNEFTKEDSYYDSNHLMLQYEWGKPLINQEDYRLLKIHEYSSLEKGEKKIYICYL